MQSEKQLEYAFQKIGYIPDTGKIAIKSLANILSTNERILAILEGTSETTVGVLVATDIRLLFVGCSPLKDTVIKKINYNEMIYIKTISTSFPSVEIEIQDKIQTIKIVGCDIKKSKEIIDLINSISEDRKNIMEDLSNLNF